LPLHHPIRVAEQWATLDMLSGGRVDFAAGRGYDRREYAPLGVSFDDNQAIFEEGMEIVRRLWESERPLSHHGAHYNFDDVAITPRPVQRPIPAYVASFSRPSIELAGRLGCNLIVAPFAAAMTFGGLRQVAELYRETCARHGKPAGRLMCSYFLHFADTPEAEAAARARQIRYYKECATAAFPGDPATAPPSYRYFIEIVDRLTKVRPQDLGENSVLIGSPAQITDILKKVEAAGIDEVILYVNVGLKPHPQVRDEMARFMAEVAPNF
jgi:alkanesulfonate monooxygenase SsuD/methylene tetrahydromethanopterin reductase-like flavin-dependent oxidoreductase (luciferase family)